MPKWKDEEIKFLIQNYDKMTYRELAEKLGRNIVAVANKLKRLRKKGLVGRKFTMPRKCRKWTEEENRILRWLYGKIPTKDLKEYFFKDRSVNAIHYHANWLGLRSNRRLLSWIRLERGAKVRRAEIISALLDMGGVATIGELYGLFKDRVSRQVFATRLNKMTEEGILKRVRLYIGRGGGLKYSGHRLVDGIAGETIYYISEDDLYNYLVDFLGDEISVDMPHGKKVAFTRLLRRCLPESVFLRLREKYAIYSKSRNYSFGH